MTTATPTLPLAPRDFLILLALVNGRAHGYAILQSIAEESADTVHMDPANLYRTLRRLAREGFMINLRKSQLGHDTAKVLGHTWTSGGFWAPVTTKLEAL